MSAAVVLQHPLLWSAAWDGGSVWDLPIDSVAQAPTIEQMQQYEKAKTAKVRPGTRSSGSTVAQYWLTQGRP